jgi:hypothetical protein
MSDKAMEAIVERIGDARIEIEPVLRGQRKLTDNKIRKMISAVVDVVTVASSVGLPKRASAEKTKKVARVLASMGDALSSLGYAASYKSPVIIHEHLSDAYNVLGFAMRRAQGW